MRKQKSNESKLFLMELVIAIFFFAVIVAVCIQAFSEAHAMSIASEKLVQGVNAVSNVAEYFTVWDGNENSWQEFFPEGSWEKDAWKQEFDENWEPVSKAGIYVLTMKISEESNLQQADIMVEEKEAAETIYQLEVERGK